jgi:hypothetical protein
MPNPNDGLFSITSNIINAQLEITNLQGAIVYQENLLQAVNSIDLQTIPAGMYFVKLNHSTGSISKKTIIKK